MDYRDIDTNVNNVEQGLAKKHRVLMTIISVASLVFLAWAITTTVALFRSDSTEPPTPPNPYVLEIVTFNDVYEILPVAYGTEGYKRGGVSRVARFVRDLRAKNPNLLVLGGGDFISPSMMSTLFDGAQMIDALNVIGLNYTCLGNHEFDMGTSVLIDRIRQSKFTWLNSNIVNSTDGSQFYTRGSLDGIIYNMPGTNIRIGLFGVLYDFVTGGTPDKSQFTILDVTTTARRVAQKLKNEDNVDFVIALTHMTANDNCQLTKNVPEIDLIVSGHDHLMETSLACGAPFFTASQDWINVWKLSIDFTNVTLKGPTISSMNVPITFDMPTDVEAEPMIEFYVDEMQRQYSVVIGETTVDLDANSRISRTQETNLGNFIADTAREALDADIALINGGGIRSNRILPKGPITVGDIVSFLPFANHPVGVYVTGSVLRSAMEASVSKIDVIAGGFLQISGIKLTYVKSNPVGSRVQSLTFTNGTAIDPDVTLRVAMPDFISKGGDVYSMFEGLPQFAPEETTKLMSSYLIDRIRSMAVISPQIEGRIVALS